MMNETYERRSAPRHQVEALQVELPDFQPRLRDLSLAGAYIEDPRPISPGHVVTLRISSAERVLINAKAMVRRADEGKGMAVEFLEIGAAGRKELRTLLGEESEERLSVENILVPDRRAARRRRSTRTALRIPVRVEWVDQEGRTQEERTETQVVNAHGCLLLLEQPVKKGLKLTIANLQTKQISKGKVALVRGEQPGGKCEVGVELARPDPKFWGDMYFHVWESSNLQLE
jgi:hypothetical protein